MKGKPLNFWLQVGWGVKGMRILCASRTRRERRRYISLICR